MEIAAQDNTHPTKARKRKAKRAAGKRTKRQVSKLDKVELKPNLDHYKVGLAKTAGGHRTVDIGDGTAKQLRGLDLDKVYAIAAKALGTPEKELRAKYAHLNPGMQRMNLGNKMRAAANSKEAK
jgi:hypothetical protein